MDKNTLSNYGWIVIAVLVLSVMIALATPFGSYIENGVRSTTEGLFATSEQAMNIVGMTAGNGNFEEGYQDPAEKSAKLNPNGIIPEGAVYYVQPTNQYRWQETKGDVVLYAGDVFPEPQDGDAYIFEGFEYRYNRETRYTSWSKIPNNADQGWGVAIADDYDQNFGVILESIAGKPITNCTGMFYDYRCESIPDITIPKTVTRMYGMFAYSAITHLPDNFKIPEGVKVTDGMFESSKIVTLPNGFTIPNSVTTMESMFENCRNLVSLPEGFKISENITNAKYVFMGCESLMKVSKMFTKTADNANFNKFFGGCTALTQLPEGFTLPQNNIDAYLMFNKTGLTSLPDSFVIYEYMTKTTKMFLNCYSLSGSITVDSDYVCQNFIANTQITEIKGKTTKANEWLKTKVYYDETIDRF